MELAFVYSLGPCSTGRDKRVQREERREEGREERQRTTTTEGLLYVRSIVGAKEARELKSARTREVVVGTPSFLSLVSSVELNWDKIRTSLQS